MAPFLFFVCRLHGVCSFKVNAFIGHTYIFAEIFAAEQNLICHLCRIEVEVRDSTDCLCSFCLNLFFFVQFVIVKSGGKLVKSLNHTERQFFWYHLKVFLLYAALSRTRYYSRTFVNICQFLFIDFLLFQYSDSIDFHFEVGHSKYRLLHHQIHLSWEISFEHLYIWFRQFLNLCKVRLVKWNSECKEGFRLGESLVLSIERTLANYCNFEKYCFLVSVLYHDITLPNEVYVSQLSSL